MRRSVSCSGANKRAKKFLEDVMGRELSDKLINNGMIEIKSGKNTYILCENGNIINKKANRTYCIVPKNSNYPIYDILAIKYAWLKYRSDVIERIERRNTSDNRYLRLYYSDFVHEMEHEGWTRQRLTLDQHNQMVTTHALQKGQSGPIVTVRCPAGNIITIAGTGQITALDDIKMTHSISLKIIDKNKQELDERTIISMDYVTRLRMVVRVTDCMYSMIRSNICTDDSDGDDGTGSNTYKLYAGIHLSDDESFVMRVKDSSIKILPENIQVKIECDYWTHGD